MAEVRRAVDAVLGRDVAYKVLRDEHRAHRARFEEEARLTAQLEHPGIVPVHDRGVDEQGRPWFTMKAVDGLSLRQALDQGALEGRAQRLEVLRRVCEAVAFAHAHAVLHRDLKPDNIMVGAFGEVLVMDWGLAARMEDGLAPGLRAGTPAYMAPEQARGEACGVQADVYALGAMLYELLADRPPLRGKTTSMVQAAEAGRVVAFDGRGQPRALVHILQSAMHPDVAQRTPDVPHLLRGLEAFLADMPVQGVAYGVMELSLMWVRRHRQVVGGALAVGVIAAALGGWGLATYLRDTTAARDHAVAEAKRALTAEREARLALAAGQVSVGDAMVREGRVREARHSFEQARAGFEEVEGDTLPARLALGRLAELDPPPLAKSHVVADPGVVVFSPDGAHVLVGALEEVLELSVPTLEVTRRWPLPAGDAHTMFWVEDRPTVAWVAGDSMSWGPLGGPASETLPLPRTGVGVGHNHGLVHVSLDDQSTWWVHLQSARSHSQPRSAGRFTLSSTPRDPFGLLVDETGGVVTLEGTVLDVGGPMRWGRMSPDGGRLVVADEAYVSLWDVQPLALRWRAQTSVAGMAVFLDDGSLVTTGLDRQVSIWSPEGELTGRLTGGVDIATMSAHGRSVVGRMMDGTIVLWSAPDGGGAPWNNGLFALSVSADGALVAGAGADAEVGLWHRESRRSLKKVAGHGAETRGVALSADGTTLATGGRDGEVRIWDVLTGELDRTWSPSEQVLGLDWLDDSHLAVAGFTTLNVLDVQTGEAASLPASPHGTWDVVRTPSGGASVGFTDGLLQRFSAAGRLLQTIELGEGLRYKMCSTPDERFYFVGTYGGVVERIDVAGGVVDHSWTAHDGPVLATALSPDVRLLATGGFDGRIRLWDPDTGEELASFGAHEGSVSDIAFTSARTLVSAAGNGQVRTWLLEGPVRDPPVGELALRSLLSGDPARALELVESASDPLGARVRLGARLALGQPLDLSAQEGVSAGTIAVLERLGQR
jgi:WD40 repeat protein